VAIKFVQREKMSIELIMSDDFTVLLDAEDFDKVSKYNWRVEITPWASYARATINKKTVRMHKFITGFNRTDHINGNGLDNRRENLRECTNQQNSFNSRKPRGNTSSKYKGVWRDHIRNKWDAYIKKNYKRIHLGRFKDEIEAAKVYDKKAKELFGEFAKLNFPGDNHVV